ncbi:MAG: AbrB/MazE/SpoVT family DNA-binding domain-containing protein [Patescibacteria group bacterium]|nr:AbrB/MazE/SpoVT family DNA-binding domain-containing protein [Patescibacteria group bacterium]
MNVLQSYSLPVSSKGQVTIPIDIRHLFNLGKVKRVVLELFDNKTVQLRPRQSSLSEVYGSVKPIKKSFKEIRKIVREERVDRLI